MVKIFPVWEYCQYSVKLEKIFMKCAVDEIAKDHNIIKNFGRIGLVINQTSTSSSYISSAEIIYQSAKKTPHSKVTAVFGPQHGYSQTEQDNMRETPDSEFQFSDNTRVPLFSLYSKERAPTEQQLKNVDTLLVDLQDIGCRVYTYMLTLAGCLRSAAQYGKKVVVLDRENPLGLCYFNSQDKSWKRVEGNQFQTEYHSFVGWYDIPIRHGLSMGELGYYFIQCDKLTLDYEVIKVTGLTRSEPLQIEHKCVWTMPSPNIPNYLSAFLFPAFVTLEGTNISEGRGTTLPFQLIGAPWLKTKECISFFQEYKKYFTPNLSEPDGLIFREHDFRPTFNKYKDEICHGIQIHPQNLENINLFKFGLTFLIYCQLNQIADFKWAKPGYEYNFTEAPINLILGSRELSDFFSQIHKITEIKKGLEEFDHLMTKLDKEGQAFCEKAKNCFIYK